MSEEQCSRFEKFYRSLFGTSRELIRTHLGYSAEHANTAFFFWQAGYEVAQ